MSQDRNNQVMMDVTGRVLSLEQRVKGLHGRIAAIEARLSIPGSGMVSSNSPDEEFVPANSQFDHHTGADYCVRGDPHTSDRQTPGNARAGTAWMALHSYDMTGLIAGCVLIGAGILLVTGNVDVIKNPIAAIGCGIMLIISALKRKPHK